MAQVTTTVLRDLVDAGLPITTLLHQDGVHVTEAHPYPGRSHTLHTDSGCEDGLLPVHATWPRGRHIDVESCWRCSDPWPLWDDVEMTLAGHHSLQKILERAALELDFGRVRDAGHGLARAFTFVHGQVHGLEDLGHVQDVRLADAARADAARLRGRFHSLRRRYLRALHPTLGAPDTLVHVPNDGRLFGGNAGADGPALLLSGEVVHAHTAGDRWTVMAFDSRMLGLQYAVEQLTRTAGVTLLGPMGPHDGPATWQAYATLNPDRAFGDELPELLATARTITT